MQYLLNSVQKAVSACPGDTEVQGMEPGRWSWLSEQASFPFLVFSFPCFPPTLSSIWFYICLYQSVVSPQIKDGSLNSVRRVAGGSMHGG